MGLGIIGYCCSTGLGQMTRELRQKIGPGFVKQFTIAHSGFNPPFDFEWAQDTFLNGINQDDPFDYRNMPWEVQKEHFEEWIRSERITTVISIETGFGPNTFRWCRNLGVKTILIPMWEFFTPMIPEFCGLDLYLCPSWKCLQEVPFENKQFIPWPVDTDAIPYTQRTGKAKTFIHNAGGGGMNGRKGTYATIMAFLEADVDAKLIVRCQKPIAEIIKSDPLYSQSALVPYVPRDPRVEIREGSVPTVAELYAEGDVLTYPSKYDGHSLVGLEGMAAGIPVITTDAAPMNELFHTPELLVRVASELPAGLQNPHCMMNNVDILDLAAKIRWCTENDMADISKKNRTVAVEEHSWLALRNRWSNAIQRFEAKR